MTAFNPDVDAAAVPHDPLSVEPAAIAEQFNGLKWPAPYFSNAFRAWCAYGRSTTGRTDDGRTWVFVDADAPRKGAPASSAPSPAGIPQSAPTGPDTRLVRRSVTRSAGPAPAAGPTGEISPLAPAGWETDR